MTIRFTNVGLVVKDINKAIDLYTKAFGFEPGPFGVMEDAGFKKFAFIIGYNPFELLQPTDPESHMGKFLKERGRGLYQLSFRCDDLDATVQSLREKGVIVGDPVSATYLPFPSRIAWVDPQSVNGAVIELVERPEELAPKSTSKKMIKRFTHVGLVVRDINKAIDLYTKAFGFKPGPFGMMGHAGLKNFAVTSGHNFIEFIQPLDPDCWEEKLLKERGEGLSHLSLTCDGLDATVQSLREKGVIVGDPISLTFLPFLSRIAWVDPQSVDGAVIELAEHPKGLARKSN